jgi:hypothetical protein
MPPYELRHHIFGGTPATQIHGGLLQWQSFYAVGAAERSPLPGKALRGVLPT